MTFQFTPLREGRRRSLTRFSSRLLFQFTPLREGRRYVGRVFQRIPISIHAPPRGATASRNATMRRGTFQFTPLREGRRSGRRLSRRKTPISIHAPPRGATYLLGNGVELENISIHAPPRGATRKGRAHGNIGVTFQFTPLREGRRAGQLRWYVPRYFNSRPSARGDAE